MSHIKSFLYCRFLKLPSISWRFAEGFLPLQAVQAVLNDYDWVFWLDSDAWITNYDIKLESILPKQGFVDFVVTEDANGPNAGSWMIRNSDWSRKFLETWWNLKQFRRVRCPLLHVSTASSTTFCQQLFLTAWCTVCVLTDPFVGHPHGCTSVGPPLS
jgi:hypothetical protein